MWTRDVTQPPVVQTTRRQVQVLSYNPGIRVTGGARENNQQKSVPDPPSAEGASLPSRKRMVTRRTGHRANSELRSRHVWSLVTSGR